MSVKPTTRCVIFDMDGVLLDTEPIYTRATQSVVGRFGKSFDWSLKANMIGRSSARSAEYLVGALQLPITAETYLAQRHPLLLEGFAHAPAMPGARDLVVQLAERGVPLALATSSDRELFDVKSAAHDWFDRFGVVICGDDPRIGALKPAPDIFLLAAAELGLPAEAALVFEDSPAGVTAARAAGMRVIALPAPELDRALVRDAERILDSLDSIRVQDLSLLFP